MTHPHPKERRKSIRFRPKDGTMAINTHTLGPVINISMGGLSFRYMENASSHSPSNTLGLFLSSDDILIDKLSTRVVSDKLFSQGSSFSKSAIRQRSIQFLDLTTTQKKALQEFILTKTHTLHP